MRHFLKLALLLALPLTGCSQLGTLSSDDPLAFLAAGSELQLNQDLKIPAGATRIFFQQGKAITKGQLNYYQPSCDLEVWKLEQKERTVFKDLFVVGKFSSGIEQIVMLDNRQLAGNLLHSRFFKSDSPSVHRFVRVDLHSAAQPDVMRLTCRGAWADYYEARYPNAVEIKLALGNIMVFL